MQNYEHQLEVRKRDGTVYHLYVVSHGSGYTYIILKDSLHVHTDPNVYDAMDTAFQLGFEWIKAQK